MIFWSVTIAVSVALLVLTAAARGSGVEFAYAHMAISAAVALAMALVAIREIRSLPDTASEGEVSGLLSRNMGLIWIWGALSLLVTYATGIVSWREWPAFFVVFAGLGAACLFLGSRLPDADATLLKVSRYLGMLQLGGMLVVMIGLVVDGKMSRFLEIQDRNWQDWAANNYFFFGAMALAILSAYGLRATGAKRTSVSV